MRVSVSDVEDTGLKLTPFAQRARCSLDGVDMTRFAKAADDEEGWVLSFEHDGDKLIVPLQLRLHYGDVRLWFDPPLNDAERDLLEAWRAQ